MSDLILPGPMGWGRPGQNVQQNIDDERRSRDELAAMFALDASTEGRLPKPDKRG